MHASEFLPPGPGVWELEATHLQRPVSRAMAAVFPDAATAGFRWTMARYGLLLDYLEFKVVNRFVYLCPRPVGAPKGAKGPPPKLIFKLLTKLHPEVRRRIRTVRETFATKRWREDVARWDSEWKPEIARENTQLQAVDASSLSNDALRMHLNRCFEVVRAAVTRHHTLNATTMLPLGDFLVHVGDWTGLTPAEVLPLFRGSSRVSRGAADELDAVRRALSEHPDAAMLLASGDPGAVLAALSARTDAVGDAVRRFVDAAGVRIATGYDFADLTLAEMPELLVESIRTALTAETATTTNDVAQREASIRERVPAAHRQEFDDLLTEARLTYRIRDERTYDNDMWSAGIARRAILAAGTRLAAKGKLHDAQHAVELTPAEIDSMLNGGGGPTADELAAHAAFRTTHTVLDAPPHLGGVPSGPPPTEWLPPHAARAARAIGIVMGEMFAVNARQKASPTITGFAASPGEITGVARLVLDPGDMGAVRKGDVLVARATSPSYNVLLPLISGIVTDRGGTLSHAAVIAREYGIPAVVGCGNATELVKDGTRIRVNGSKGTVDFLT